MVRVLLCPVVILLGAWNHFLIFRTAVARSLSRVDGQRVELQLVIEPRRVASRCIGLQRLAMGCIGLHRAAAGYNGPMGPSMGPWEYRDPPCGESYRRIP